MSFISLKFALFCIITIVIYYLAGHLSRVCRLKRDKDTTADDSNGSKIIQSPQWMILLAASIVFYSFCGIKYLGYILITSVTVYFSARVMDSLAKKRDTYLKEHKAELGKEEKKAYKATVKKKQRWLLFFCLLVNVGILFVIKYADLLIAYFNYYRLMLTGNVNFVVQPGFILPLGISFYTFQSLGYLIDVYYSKVESEKNFARFLLFVSFFPQIVQGPISRFADLEPELFGYKEYKWENIKSGLFRVFWGLFKKLVISDRLAPYVTSCTGLIEYYKGPYLLLCIFVYAFRIYGDFSGGIDVAIGVAEMLGIRLTENFERPFFSKSISEYWRRWHMTLGTWFRDYIFYPLSVNKHILNLGKWVRTHISEGLGKRIPIYLPMIAVWMLTGMWHGSEGRFVTWGLLNCFFIILGTEFEPLSCKIMDKLKLTEEMTIVKLYRIFKTFWLMSFLRVFDLVRTSKDGFKLIRDVFRGWSLFDINEVYTTLKLPKEEMIVAILAIVVLVIVSLIQRRGSIRERLFKKNMWLQFGIFALLASAVLIFGNYGMGYDAASFIYINF